MRIFKYAIPTDNLSLMLPRGAQLLTAQTQNDLPQLWALVDERAPLELRKLAVYGTGQEMPSDPGRYLGTFQLAGGSLVFHAFETQPSPLDAGNQIKESK